MLHSLCMVLILRVSLEKLKIGNYDYNQEGMQN